MVQLICYAQRQVVRSAAYVQRIKFLNMQVGRHWTWCGTLEGFTLGSMGPSDAKKIWKAAEDGTRLSYSLF
jgi:hypothetical protein